jgi:hypothetical protein
MPAVSKAQQKFMGMVHATQKGDIDAPSKEVEKAADSTSDKSAKDFASTSHKGLPNRVKEGSVTDRPEEPTSNDLDALPSAVIPGVSEKTTNEGPLGTMRDTKPTPTNDILWKATGKVCEGRSMAERVKMYEKKGGGWRLGKHVDETVYTTLGEFYKNEIKPRKEAKELMVKRRLGEAKLNEMTDEVSEADGVDHEVSMARASLVNISKACQDLMGKIGSQEKDLPGWIQDHITNSENYIMQASKGYHEIDDKLKGNTITGPNQLDQNGK